MGRKILIKSITAGFLIGLGGTAFLSVDDKIIGSILFSLGLLAICTTNQNLFTGKVSYKKDPIYLLIVLTGNWIGATLIGELVGIARPEIVQKACKLCNNKLNEEWWRIIILGILCNILIYFAVEGYKNNQILLLIMCVAAFILCGFEHCIANMFYFAVANKFAIVYIFLNIIGNTIGGVIVYWMRELLKSLGDN